MAKTINKTAVSLVENRKFTIFFCIAGYLIFKLLQR